MAASTEGERAGLRLLGLGNEILADDAFGIRVAQEVERRYTGRIQVAYSSASSFVLMDDVLGASRLLVVDTIVTGRSKPGTIHVFTADQIQPAPGGSPHFVGLFEMLAVGRQLGLPVPQEAVIIAVEASDCTTVGGPMCADVRSAIAEAVDLVGQFLAHGSLDPAAWPGSHQI